MNATISATASPSASTDLNTTFPYQPKKVYKDWKEDYIDAFLQCYPGKKVEIKKAKKQSPNNPAAFFIIIDGERGDRPYSVFELVEATKCLKQGRH